MTISTLHIEQRRRGAVEIVRDWLANMNVNLFFFCIFLYHVLVIFQGLDFNDEGFHLAFYQQVFSDPESVQYAFWGWLAGIVGGSFMKLFPFLGMWGIRLLGAFVSTCTLVIAYNLLKKYLDKVTLMVSMTLLSLFINEDAKNLYYNNLSAFLYIVSASFVFLGLKEEKKWMLAAGGFFAGMNVFSRIPNVLGISMVLSILYFAYLKKRPMKEAVGGALLFLGGAIMACLLVFLVMVSLDHLRYFTGSIQMVFAPSRGSKDDGLNGAYGFSRLLTSNLLDYAKSLRFVVLIGFFPLLLGYLIDALRLHAAWVRVVVRTFQIVLFLGLLALVGAGWFTKFRLMEFFVGMSLLSAMLLFDRRISAELKVLTFIGGLITLVHPFGSSEGISTVVIYSIWLSFPIALDYIAKWKLIDLDLEIKTQFRKFTIRCAIPADRFRRFLIAAICLISAACLYNVIRYPYLCDKHNRLTMRYSVDNILMRGVYTSKARADALNELQAASARFIKPNDIVLAYDCMPMYHFMTRTRSYVRNPCIWFYTTDMFRKELNLAESTKKELPVIVRQLIKTTGEGSAWPDIRPAENYLQFKRNQGKNKILDEFILRHGYSEAWNDGNFAILLPGNK